MCTLAQDCCACRCSIFSIDQLFNCVCMHHTEKCDHGLAGLKLQFQVSTRKRGERCGTLHFDLWTACFTIKPAPPDFLCSLNPTQTSPTFRVYRVCQEPGSWKVCGTVGCRLTFGLKLTSCVLWIFYCVEEVGLAVVSALTHVLAKSDACSGQILPREASCS